MKTQFAVLFGLAILAGACGPGPRGDDDGVGDDDDMPPPPPPGEMKECNKMDIVFVVDDSGSMAEEQSNLATNFPMFAQVLSTYTTSDGQPLDYRVAVTTTGRDMDYVIDLGQGMTLPQHEDGDNGAFRATCGSTKRYLEPADANMSQTLSCRANVGTGGPSYEMPLLMSKWALSERIMDSTNAGFLRDDALLAIVMITDENDSSTTANNWTVGFAGGDPPPDWHPADHVQFLDALKGHRSRWAAGVIAGDGNCSSSFGDAVDATRLKEFVNLANGSGTTQAVFSSICAGDLTVGLKSALDTFQAACGGIIL
jgi:hypothetical protein